MGTKHALIVAVESYYDGGFEKVAFARASAGVFASALGELGFECEVLLDHDATKSRVDSFLRRRVRALTAADTFFVYYVGHGFSEGAESYLTCHDTISSDRAPTSYALGSLYDHLSASACTRTCLFLEAGDCDISTPQNCVRFTACASGQRPRASSTLGHGVWTHQLVEALQGRAKAAIARDGLVTVSSLQSYLSSVVPETLRKMYEDMTVRQTPGVRGTEPDRFVVADVSARRAPTAAPELRQLRRILFRQESVARVKSLRGFEKRHVVPTASDDRSNAFVARCADAELLEMRDAVYLRIKDVFRYKRKQLEAYEDVGVAGVITPAFTFQVRVELDAADPSNVVWYRELINIENTAVAESDAFEELFGSAFQTLEYEFETSVDLVALIDEIEDLDDPNLSVAAPPDASYCEVRIASLGFSVRIEPRTLSIRFGKSESPRQLVAWLKAVQTKLTVERNLQMLPL